MALNLLSPTIFTTSLLIAEVVKTPGGSTDSIPQLTEIGGNPVSAALELQARDSALLLTRMTTAERDLMLTPADGMLFFNESAGVFQFRSGGTWNNISPGGGDVNGPVVSVKNDIAIFDDTTGKLLADSGVSITSVPLPASLVTAGPLANVTDLGNLGILTFVDPGFISITGGTPLSNYVSVAFHIDSVTNLTTTLFLDQTASLVPSSISALVELSSTTGALLLSRLTTAEKNALIAEDGMILYDVTTQDFNIHVAGNWEPLITAGGLPWTLVVAPITMMANNGYIIDATTTVTLPAIAGIGDEFRIAGHIGIWTIAQNAGQDIQFGNVNTTIGAGGSLVATDNGDSVELVCIVANTTFAVISSIGNITVT